MTATVEELGSPAEQRVRWRGIVASLLLHLAIIAALLGWWRPAPPPEVALPVVRIVLEGPGSAGVAGGGGGQGEAESATPATAQSAEAPPAAADTTTAPTETPPPPVPEPPQTAATTPPKPFETPPPVPAPTPQREAAVIPPPPPLPSHKPTPPHPTRPPPQAVKPPPPTPLPAATPAPAAPLAPPAAIATAAPSPGSLGGPGGTTGPGKGTEGRGHGVAGNGSIDGPGDDYLAALQRWLTRYKRYPREAIEKKQEGTVMVGFTLARDGTVLEAWIERSSGVPSIDQAALDMLHRASPVPRIPDRYKGDELKLAMPIDYTIGFFEKIFR